ncbi:MAG TPA: MFS transporter, partial [Acidimicrobiales bacterium]|nr:MFS transporter [Acidimicrobiales bacterium]
MLASSTVSNLGDGIFLVALPLLTAQLTRDPAAVAGVAVAQGLPWLAFSLVAGALVDRLDRRRVMWITDVARAVLVAGLALAVALDAHSVPMLYAVAFGLGLAETMFDNAAQAILPRLVPSTRLEAANGRLFAAQMLTNDFLGKPVGGLLFTIGAALPFWVDAGTFAVAALLIALVPGSYRTVRTGPPRSLRTEIAEGLGWLWRHPVLRTLGVLLG